MRSPREQQGLLHDWRTATLVRRASCREESSVEITREKAWGTRGQNDGTLVMNSLPINRIVAEKGSRESSWSGLQCRSWL